jgi:transposase InsO family protein
VKDFYLAHGVCHQTFSKYYNRYKQSNGEDLSLLPQARGPKYLSRRVDINIENSVIEIRKKGLNKYEIYDILKGDLHERTPSVSCIYKIFKRNNMNKLQQKEKEEKRRIIRQRAGELAHIDCHYLSRDMIDGDKSRYYLLSVIDDQSRIGWCELIDDIKSLTVMFSTLRCFNHIKRNYGIEFEEVLTDNGSEFGIKTSSKKELHPFERMLLEMGIKHRYTKPYRPQTNGKVERFWRTLNDDLINETYFQSKQHFSEELMKYIIYYNELRPHQGINGLQPKMAINM